MIISASYRTDIPAYYGAWFQQRLAAGETWVKNPYGGKPYRVDLSQDAVSGFVFWTRNPSPFETGFTAVAERGHPFTLQMTITGYPRSLEPGTLDAEAAVAALRSCANNWGSRRIVWRYDPVIVSEATPPDWHERQVRRLAGHLRGYVDECVLSFMHPYRKAKRNLAANGVSWRDPDPMERRAILAKLAEIVADAGILPTLCAQPDLLASTLQPATCIDVERLSAVAGRDIQARTKGQRPGCLCAEARDIGAYDTCPQGCAYCYANRDRATARRNLAEHDTNAAALTRT